jgi:hypothetical protein
LSGGQSAGSAAVAAFRITPRYGFVGQPLGIAPIFGRAAALANALAAFFADGIAH